MWNKFVSGWLLCEGNGSSGPISARKFMATIFEKGLRLMESGLVIGILHNIAETWWVSKK
jgi:hypothetical protein